MCESEKQHPFDDTVVRRHTMATGHTELAYSTVVGRFTLREAAIEDGRVAGPVARANLFLCSYLRDVAPEARRSRPVVFVFNGGPGSSSMWLHLGLFGPRRVLSGDAGRLREPPYGLADNPDTPLRDVDLVFIDPVDTGYSRVAEGVPAGEFHGTTRDIESVAEVIRAWTTHHGRWMSPKFVAGESYGTVRAVGVVNFLQRTYGMYFNGLILLSPVLNGIGDQRGYAADVVTALRLPTYAAVAHHHGRHPGRDLDSVLREAEEYASAEYPRVLALGSRLRMDERHTAVARISALTGLSPEFVDRVDLRVGPGRYYAELLREQRLVVSRMDGRFTGWNPDGGYEMYEEDPALQALLGPYCTAFNEYVREELGYEPDVPFFGFNYRAVMPWKPRSPEEGGTSMLADLSYAMRSNRHLRVHAAFGYLDGSTPYWASEHELAHLQIPEQLRANIEQRFYPAGHMMYVHEASRLRQSRDLVDFVLNRSSTPGATASAVGTA